MPSEDLADVLEELQGEEQEALFGALDSEKAAETLAEAEPRAKRQLVEDLSDERAREIFSEMTVPQLADLFAVLPFDEVQELLELLNAQVGERVRNILSEREAEADDIMSQDYVAMPKEARVAEVLKSLRQSGREPRSISYVYVVNGDNKTLIGVVDLRELTLAPDEAAARRHNGLAGCHGRERYQPRGPGRDVYQVSLPDDSRCRYRGPHPGSGLLQRYHEGHRAPCESPEKETNMPRVQITKTVKVALYCLRFYLLFLLALLLVRFIKGV